MLPKHRTKYDKLTKKDKVSLTFKDATGNTIKSFSTKPNRESKEAKLVAKEGANVFYWDMMYDGAERVQGMI